MDLRDFYRLLRRNFPIVAISLIFGLVSSGIITLVQTPMYQATIQLFVSTPSSALDISALVQGSSFSQQRVKSYAQIINGPETLKPVIKELGLNTTADKLAKRINASAPLDTVLINVTVTDENPVKAAEIANAVGDQFSITVNKLELASDKKSGGAIKVSMVKSAIPPKSPASPKKSLNLLLGLILGFGLGVGISILRQIFDNTIKNEDDLDQTPLLAVIPFDKGVDETPLITQISKWASRTEAIRQLRTNLQYLKADNPPKVISITSGLPGEGKSVTATNLALSLGYSGLKVMLIEADLRRPKVATYLGLSEKGIGLSEILSGKIAIADSVNFDMVIQKGPEDLIDVITSGKLPPNPTELLDSQAFESLIANLQAKYDYIILDSPPSLPVSDASIISAKVDGTLLVIKAGATKKAQFAGTRNSLTAVGGNVLGAVLNMVPEANDEGEYGYKYTGGYNRRYRYGYRYSKGYENYSAKQPYAPQDTKK